MVGMESTRPHGAFTACQAPPWARERQRRTGRGLGVNGRPGVTAARVHGNLTVSRDLQEELLTEAGAGVTGASGASPGAPGHLQGLPQGPSHGGCWLDVAHRDSEAGLAVLQVPPQGPPQVTAAVPAEDGPEGLGQPLHTPLPWVLWPPVPWGVAVL